MNRTAIRSSTRKAAAMGIYRGLLNTALLVALFRAFPAYEPVSILAVLAFSQGIAGVGLAVNHAFVTQNALDDVAERKTRHTVVLAADPAWRDAYDFWGEVNNRVAAEQTADEPAPWWGQIGLTMASFVGLLLSDVAAVVFALVIAGLTAG